MGGVVTEFSLVFIFNRISNKVLLVNKNKGYYIGKTNGVGGKIDPDDNTPRAGALREVFEETGYLESDFRLFDHLMTESYPSGCVLYIFYGVLNNDKDFEQKETEELFWRNIHDLAPVTSNKWAGEGGPAYYIQSAMIEIGMGYNIGI